MSGNRLPLRTIDHRHPPHGKSPVRRHGRSVRTLATRLRSRKCRPPSSPPRRGPAVLEIGRNPRRDLGLDGQGIGERPVVAGAPQVIAAFNADQLDGDPDTIFGDPDRSLDAIASLQSVSGRNVPRPRHRVAGRQSAAPSAWPAPSPDPRSAPRRIRSVPPRRSHGTASPSPSARYPAAQGQRVTETSPPARRRLQRKERGRRAVCAPRTAATIRFRADGGPLAVPAAGGRPSPVGRCS